MEINGQNISITFCSRVHIFKCELRASEAMWIDIRTTCVLIYYIAMHVQGGSTFRTIYKKLKYYNMDSAMYAIADNRLAFNST